MWKSREVSVRQVNVLIRAVTCLASVVETLPQSPEPVSTSDINSGGLICSCASHSGCGTVAAINAARINHRGIIHSNLPLKARTGFKNSHGAGLADQYS